MSTPESRHLLILIDGADWPADLPPLVQALQQQGARVTVQTCTEPYAAVLDGVAAADTVLHWR
jgi:hypothetical protein